MTFAARPALHPALRPRHRAGRRDPGQRDGHHRHRGRPTGPTSCCRRCTPPTPHHAHPLVEMGGWSPSWCQRPSDASWPSVLARRLCEKWQGGLRAERGRAAERSGTWRDWGARPSFPAGGCAACGKTGYHGRFAIHEVLMSPRDRAHDRGGEHSEDMKKMALAQGMLTLRQAGSAMCPRAHIFGGDRLGGGRRRNGGYAGCSRRLGEFLVDRSLSRDSWRSCSNGSRRSRRRSRALAGRGLGGERIWWRRGQPGRHPLRRLRPPRGQPHPDRMTGRLAAAPTAVAVDLEGSDLLVRHGRSEQPRGRGRVGEGHELDDHSRHRRARRAPAGPFGACYGPAGLVGARLSVSRSRPTPANRMPTTAAAP